MHKSLQSLGNSLLPKSREQNLQICCIITQIHEEKSSHPKLPTGRTWICSWPYLDHNLLRPSYREKKLLHLLSPDLRVTSSKKPRARKNTEVEAL
jgi:hypothetical protein